MGRSALIAALVVVALVLWMLSGQLGSEDDSQETVASSEQEKPATKMKVQTQLIAAESITREVVVQGQLEPLNIINVRAETSGNIQQLYATKGERIRRGQQLASLTIDTRNADLAVAQANQVQAEKEYQAARKLQRSGFQSEANLESATARREAALAQVQAAELAIGTTNISAPIDALIEDVHVKQGDYVDNGASIATLIDNSQLLVTGRVPQQRIADIKTGQTATAKLVTGGELQGTVKYISSMADSARSFKVEILISSPPARTLTGISAEISIPVENLMAHRLSPAVLSLDDSGSLGVKAIGPDNIVKFHEIEVVKTESNGAWVTGLPENINVITLGQGFVNPGEEVDPVAADKPAQSSEQSSNQPQNNFEEHGAPFKRVAKL